MTTPVLVGLVGAGRLAELGYLPALASVPQLRLVGLADPDRARAQALAAAAGARVEAHTSLRSLVERTELGAVVVASPAEHHLEGAAAAAEAGLPVLVEKPPATDLTGARRLAALTPAPWIGFNRRFDPGVRTLRRRVPDRGRLELELRLAYRRRSWAPRTVDDDVLLDLGPHVVDLVQWLAGTRIETVSAELDRTRGRLQLTGGRVTATAVIACDELHAEAVSVRAAGRTVAQHRSGGVVGMVTGRVATLRGRPHPLVTSLAAQLRAFAAAAQGRPAPDLATANDGVSVMAVLEAARSSAGAGHRIEPVPQEP
ncbi:MAG: Gfo/Idh/MocA family protein [Acidimicrobiia bacterium]